MSNSSNEKVSEHRDEGLGKVQTTASIPMSPELFEQLYLAPQNKIKGKLRQTFGNPTPIGEWQQLCKLYINGMLT